MYMYIYHKSFSKHLVVSFKLCLMNAAGVLGCAMKPPSPPVGVLGGNGPQKIFFNFVFRTVPHKSKKLTFFGYFLFNI